MRGKGEAMVGRERKQVKVVSSFTNLFKALYETLTDVCTQVTFLMDFLELLILRNES